MPCLAVLLISLLVWQFISPQTVNKSGLLAEKFTAFENPSQYLNNSEDQTIQEASELEYSGTPATLSHTALSGTGTPSPSVPLTGDSSAVVSVGNDKNTLLLDRNAMPRSIDWSVDNRFLYASVDNIGLVTVNTNMLSLTRIEDSYKNISLIAVDSTKVYVALAEQEDRSIHLYSRQTRKMEKTLGPLHTLPITAMVFSPDGKWLVSCGEDGMTFLWDVTNEEYSKTLLNGENCSDLTFTPSGLQLVVGFNEEGMVRLWDTKTWNEMYSFPVDGVTDVAVNPNGTRLLTASGEGYNDARIWNLYSGTLLMTLDEGSPVWAVAYSPNGNWLLTAGEGGRISVWDPQTGVLKYEFEADMQKITSLRFNASGTMLAAAGESVRLWKMSDLDLP